MYTKSSDLELKLVDDAGAVEGIASKYGVLDKDGEIMDPFAFADDLKTHGGKGLPILFQHDRSQIIGWTTGARETRDALHVSGKLNLSGKAKEVHDLIKLGLATGATPNLSIGFTVPPGGSYYEKGVRRFKKAELKEWSFVTWGASPGAVITVAKGEKAGRAISAATAAKLQEAIGHLERARDKHDDAIKILIALQNSYPQDVNEPNPVGAKFEHLNGWEVQTLMAEIDEFLGKMC